MSLWPADNNSNNKEKTTSTVKEEVPRMNTTTPSPQRLEQALEAFVGDLEGLEGSLLKFEEALLELEEGTLEEGTLEEGTLEEGTLEEGTLEEGAPGHQNGHNLRLLSPSEVCQELGEERTVVYRKLRSGEIPCLKLGHALKVRQTDLQEYMKGQQQQLRSLGEENSFRER
jgi:excisionase family DNA binding protein